MHRVGGTLVVALLLVTALLASPVAAGDPADDGPVTNNSSVTTGPKSHPNVAASLHRDRRSAAGDGRLTQSDADRVTVIVEATAGQTGAARESVARVGRVTAVVGTDIEAVVPRQQITDLANSSHVAYIRPPEPLTPHVTSEGLTTMHVDDEQARSFSGNGSTVAVIDLGFDPDHPEIAAHVIDTWDYTGDGIETGPTAHGTATAELVTDTAPNASVILISITSRTDLLQAIEDIRAHGGIDVVSISLGSPGFAPLDGTDDVDQAITDSVNDGTVWTISAGNEANGNHWNGTWRDGDADNWYNFDGSSEVNAVSGPVDVRLQWQDWPASTQDYDLYLLNGSGSIVASSTNSQTGSQPPVEQITYRQSGTYYVAIRRHNADGTADFDLWSAGGGDFQLYTNTRSITPPATARQAVAVGAVHYDTTALESFSSWGPTVDGRLKPDLVAPDGVTTATYEDFYGTSAAAPHAAGVAALVAGADPTIAGATIKNRLVHTADPLGQSPPNVKYGHGLVNATAALPPQDPMATEIAVPVINATNEDAVPVTVHTQSNTKATQATVQLRSGSTAVQATSQRSSNTTTVLVNASSLPEGDVVGYTRLRDEDGYTNVAGFTASSMAVKKDTIAPSVETSEFTSESLGNATLTFNASEQLAAATVIISNDSWSTRYHLANFSQSADSYQLSYSTTSRGNYTATIESIADSAGNQRRVGVSNTTLIPQHNFSVATHPTANVTATSATLVGEVVGFGTETAVEPNMELWQEGARDTTSQWLNFPTLSDPARFEAVRTDLQPNTTYVAQAVAYSDSKGWDSGEPVTFTTLRAYGVETAGIDEVTASTATVNGTLTGLNGSDNAELSFEYWIKGQKESSYTFTNVETRSTPGTYTGTLSGLSPNTTYVVQAVGYSDTHGWTAGSPIEVTTSSGYSVASHPASNVTATQATVHGELVGLGAADTVELNFEYWVKGNKSQTYSWASITTADSPRTYTGNLSALSPNTTYVVRSVGYSDTAGWTVGDSVTFTTSPGYAVETDPATNVTDSSMTVHGSLTGMGNASTVELNFEYWVESARSDTYSWASITTAAEPTSYQEHLSSLAANTTYVVQAVGYNGTEGWAVGDQVTVTTARAYDVTTVGVSNVSTSAATVSGRLNGLGGAEEVEVNFEYWEKGNKSQTYEWASVATLDTPDTFETDLSNLDANTSYVVRAVGHNDQTGWAAGEPIVFTT